MVGCRPLGVFEGDGGAAIHYKSRTGTADAPSRVYAGGLALSESFESLYARDAKPADAAAPLTEARSRIRNAGMRITKPRIAIIEALQRHAGPISIERIHQEAQKGDAANEGKLIRWLHNLTGMAEDIFEMTIAALVGPHATFATVARKVAAKVERDSAQR